MQRQYNFRPRTLDGLAAAPTVTVPGTARYYDNYLEYLNDRGAERNIWQTLDTLRGDPRNGAYSYQVRLDFPALATGPNVTFVSHSDLRRWVEDPARMGQNSHEVKGILYDNNSTDGLEIGIIRTERTHNPVPPRFRAGSGRAIWGYLGAKVQNCVVRQMADRVAYYYCNGEKRQYMWTSDGVKRSTTRGHPTHSPSAMKQLYKDPTYSMIKQGCDAYLQDRGLKAQDDFCFEPRDLCDLADKCGCRIVIFVSGGPYRICRWDTDDLVPVPPSQPRTGRYTFCFNMTSDQHVEILDPETMRDEYRPTRADPSRHPKIEYLDDKGFEDIIYHEGDKPPEERKLYLIRKKVSGSRYLAPVAGCTSPYAGWVLQCGDTFYKHKCLKAWTDGLIEGGLDVQAACYFTCKFDPHYHELQDTYRELNVRPIKQRLTPSLFLAAAEADMQFGHMQIPMDEGSEMYEYDGRRWYLTDWSSAPSFDYFHGVPMADVWNEYKAPGTTTTYNGRGGFEQTSRMIGNGPNDEAFTFTRDKYAIFRVEELDLSGCSENTRKHFERDGLFTTFEPSTHVLYLPSPIVHFLQVHGAVWRASRLWVCYGCDDHWVPTTAEGERVRAKLEAEKTYPMVVGLLMGGRGSIGSDTYIAPDRETADSLRWWYSSQFAAGRPTDDREDPYIVYEGEEREYESLDSIRPDTDPEDMIFDTFGVFMGTKQMHYSDIREGSAYHPREGASTIFVDTYTQDYEWRRTMCHISGAQHAYCFVRLYDAVLRLPADEVVGFSLDAFRTRTDVTHLLGDLVSVDFEWGTFKPAQRVAYGAAYTRREPMLSSLYTRRNRLRGINAEDKAAPVWNGYKDSLARVSIVTGPAGSGKTTRHFRLHDGSEDYRLPSSALYITMTNHLAHHVKTSMGVKALTNFKGFNRKVVEEEAPGVVSRYRRKHKDDEVEVPLYGSHSVLMDEVSMISTEKIRDAIKVCRSHWVQLLITGDFDADRFYQLSPVKQTEETLQTVLREEGANVKWIPPMRVFRQVTDPAFTAFLGTLRNLDGQDSWDALYSSDLFDHISYDEMLERYDTKRDLVAHPWHRIISEVTRDVYDKCTDDTEIRVRGNFDAPRKVRESDPEIIRSMLSSDTEHTVFKGSVTYTPKRELKKLVGDAFMREGLYSPTQSINPLVAATIFNLQGLSMDSDGTLYILKHGHDAREWVDPNQPKLPYVAASRARTAEGLVIVDMQRHKRARR